MQNYARKTVVCLFAGTALALGALAPAYAQPVQVQDGPVNDAVGDVTILRDVNVAVAAQVAAAICGVKVGPVAVLGRAVDRSGETDTVCDTAQGPVDIEQN